MSTPLLDLAPSAPAAPAAAPEGSPAGTSVRRVWVGRVTRALSIVVSFAALAILLRRVDLPAALRTAEDEPWQPLVAAIALNIAATLLRSVRSQAVLTTLGHRVQPARM
ncbi:MAG TPA: hypothetical protein VLO10_00250, partial [Candidatus Deferrimicrobium sp.]|nr:hypothetical protein [Candidatus Deferrimicrobium sp.]